MSDQAWLKKIRRRRVHSKENWDKDIVNFLLERGYLEARMCTSMVIGEEKSVLIYSQNKNHLECICQNKEYIYKNVFVRIKNVFIRMYLSE